MNTITFAKPLKKLMDSRGLLISRAKLMEVFAVEIRDLDISFIEYDTDNGSFSLPTAGRFAVLLFEKPETRPGESNLFTTIRKNEKNEAAEYRKHRGEEYFIQYT